MFAGVYSHVADLLTLAGRKPLDNTHSHLFPREWSSITTPMCADAWMSHLQDHPDRAYCGFLLDGLRAGFRIGFRYGGAVCKGAVSNMPTAREHPEVVSKFLETEFRAGRLIGPIEGKCLSLVQINKLGLVPKNHQPGRWRLIVDLSSPKGASVNDGIEREVCSVSYTSVDAACERVVAVGRGCQLAKFDVEGAFRTVPVHPDDRWLLGMKWEGKVYVDKVLPFGLRSAPKLYNAVADALLWIIVHHDNVNGLHYLDDFLLFGEPDSPQCGLSLQRALARCRVVGVPVAPRKTEGPTTKLVFLGIEIDTVAMTLRLPVVKLERLQREIQKWSTLKFGTKRDLLSLIGQLQHACCVIKPGRSFLRRMIELARSVRELHHRVRLNAGFRSDLKWWACFLPIWNGSCPVSSILLSMPSVELTSDASGSWGCGAYTSQGHWFQLPLPESWSGIHITIKELLPIVLGVAVWGEMWQGMSVSCRCDNAAVVAIVNSGRSKVDRAMHLMRCLSFFLARWGVSLKCRHIPGVLNGAADALSRNALPSFQRLVPGANESPTVLPDRLLECLVLGTPDWTRVDWIGMFRRFL